MLANGDGSVGVGDGSVIGLNVDGGGVSVEIDGYGVAVELGGEMQVTEDFGGEGP